MSWVISVDGTAIAFERLGDGPPVVLVGAGRAMYRPLAEELSARFAVFNYDRRGRGESGDTAPYAVEREIEDLGAVVAEAGGSAYVYGHSSGAALALSAAAAGLPISGLVLHEPPYDLDKNRRRASREFAGKIEKLLAEDRRGDAISHIFGAAGMPREMADDLMPPEVVEELSRDEGVLAMAHTFAYDSRIVGDGSVPLNAAGAVAMPALVLTDGWDYPWAVEVGEKLADVISGGRHGVLEAEDPDGDPEDRERRYADPRALARVVADFFADRDDVSNPTGG